MTDLNAKAAECLEFRKVGNFKENTIPSYYSGKQFICYVSEWLPEHRMDHAWMLVEKWLERDATWITIEDYGLLYTRVTCGTDMDDMINVYKKVEEERDTAAEAITAACVEALSKCPK